jgi:hypothetical protein
MRPGPGWDLPIEFEIVNRLTHEPMHYGQVPYRDGEDGKSTIPFLERMRVIMMNMSIATHRVDNEFNIEYHRQLRETK